MQKKLGKYWFFWAPLVLVSMLLLIIWSLMDSKTKLDLLMVNNPLNIRFNKSNKWKGSIHEFGYKGFVIFLTQVWGARAALRLLNNYIQKLDANTIEKIVNRWAPPSENPTYNYIAYVSTRLKMRRNQDLSQLSGEKYKSTLIEILKAMARFEKGKELDMTDEQIEKAYSLI